MGGVFGNIYLGEKRNASEFSKEDEASLIVLATQAGVAIANASLYDEVRSREQWLASVRDITTPVLGGGGEGPLLQSLRRHAPKQTGGVPALQQRCTRQPRCGP